MTAPGAIVCSDLATVSLLQELYAEHWGEAAQDAITNGQSKLLRGLALPSPAPSLYGCSLLPPGIPVQAEKAGGLLDSTPLLKVTARLPNGTIIHGVTNGIMLEGIQQRLNLIAAEKQRQQDLGEQERLSGCVELATTQEAKQQCVAESNERRAEQRRLCEDTTARQYA